MLNLASAEVNSFERLNWLAKSDQKLALLTGGAGFVGRHFRTVSVLQDTMW